MNYGGYMSQSHLKYISCGSGKQCLVFLHGWSCHSGFFQPQIDYFQDRYKIIAPDWMAYDGYCHDELYLKQAAEAVAKLCEQQNIHYPILIGHSMGGGTWHWPVIFILLCNQKK